MATTTDQSAAKLYPNILDHLALQNRIDRKCKTRHLWVTLQRMYHQLKLQWKQVLQQREQSYCKHPLPLPEMKMTRSKLRRRCCLMMEVSTHTLPTVWSQSLASSQRGPKHIWRTRISKIKKFPFWLSTTEIIRGNSGPTAINSKFEWLLSGSTESVSYTESTVTVISFRETVTAQTTIPKIPFLTA